MKKLLLFLAVVAIATSCKKTSTPPSHPETVQIQVISFDSNTPHSDSSQVITIHLDK